MFNTRACANETDPRTTLALALSQLECGRSLARDLCDAIARDTTLGPILDPQLRSMMVGPPALCLSGDGSPDEEDIAVAAGATPGTLPSQALAAIEPGAHFRPVRCQAGAFDHDNDQRFRAPRAWFKAKNAFGQKTSLHAAMVKLEETAGSDVSVRVLLEVAIYNFVTASDDCRQSMIRAWGMDAGEWRKSNPRTPTHRRAPVNNGWTPRLAGSDEEPAHRAAKLPASFIPDCPSA
jgi:hypothetical protein